MTIGRALLGIAIVMFVIIASVPVSSALRKSGLPINP